MCTCIYIQCNASLILYIYVYVFVCAMNTDLEMAEKLITKEAYKYDKVNGRSQPFEAWTMKRMKPIEFRDLLRSSFAIFLSKKQLGALVRKYEDKKQVGTLITSDFIVSFTRLGVELRDDKRSVNVEKAR